MSADVESGDFPSAERKLAEALRANPQSAQLHFLNGLLLHAEFIGGRISDWRVAEAAYQFALDLDPGLVDAKKQLGRLYAKVGRHRAASRLLGEYVLLRSDDSGALLDLAITAHMAGDYVVAVWAARKAHAASPDSPSASGAAAVIHAAAGLPDQAGRYMEAVARAGGAVAPIEQNVARWGQAISLTQQVAQAVDAQSTPNLPPEVQKAQQFLSQFAPKAQPAEAGSRKNWMSCDQSAPSGGPAAPSAYGYVPTTTNGTANNLPEKLPALPSPCADAPQPQMALIEAVILRTTEQFGDVRGLNFLSSLQIVARGSLRVYEKPPVSFDGGNRTYPTFFTLSLPDAGISYLLNVFNSMEGHEKVLARPSLMALDRTPSVFFAGAQISVPLAGQYGGTMVDRSIGVSLSVTPTFLDDDNLLLAIHAGRSVLDEDIQARLLQAIQTSANAVTANVRMRIGQTLVLSGLAEQEDTSMTDRTRVLGDIPVLQNLFRRNEDNRTRNSLLIMLTPRRPIDAKGDAAEGGGEGELYGMLKKIAAMETKEAGAISLVAKTLSENGLLDYVRSSGLDVQQWGGSARFRQFFEGILSAIYY